MSQCTSMRSTMTPRSRSSSAPTAARGFQVVLTSFKSAASSVFAAAAARSGGMANEYACRPTPTVTGTAVAVVAAITPLASVASVTAVAPPAIGRRHAVRGGVGGRVELVEVGLGGQQRRRQDGELAVRLHRFFAPRLLASRLVAA